MKRRARHWLHCTGEYHGESFVADRRCPQNPSPEEPPVPRLCVARSIAQCMAARLYSGGSLYVYQSQRCRSNKPYGVWDEVITGERWLVPPVSLTLACVVPLPVVALANERVMAAADRAICDGSMQITLNERLTGYFDAIEVLSMWEHAPSFAVTPRDRRARRWLQKYLADPQHV